MVYNFEKIGDHLTNIAEAVLGGLSWEGGARVAEFHALPKAAGIGLESEELEVEG